MALELRFVASIGNPYMMIDSNQKTIILIPNHCLRGQISVERFSVGHNRPVATNESHGTKSAMLEGKLVIIPALGP